MCFQSVWLASSYKLYAADRLLFLQFILPATDHLRAEEWSGAKLKWVPIIGYFRFEMP